MVSVGIAAERERGVEAAGKEKARLGGMDCWIFGWV